MNYVIKIILLSTLTLTVAIFSYVQPANDNLSSSFNKFPQEYMKNIKLTKFDTLGHQIQKHTAKYWAYEPMTQQSVLELPVFTLFKDNQKLWSLSAKYAQASQKNLSTTPNLIKLWDSVVIEQEEKHTLIMKIETSELKYKPLENLIESNSLVIFNKPGMMITGNGVKADLNLKTVEILDNVKTYFLSPS